MNSVKLGIGIIAVLSTTSQAHEGHSHAPSPQTQKKIVRLNTEQPKL